MPAHAESKPASRGGPLKVLVGALLALGVLLAIGVVPKLHEQQARAAATAVVNKPRRVTYEQAQRSNA